MASFEELGVREPLARVLEEEGIEHPTALQRATIPVLRREGNLVARAGSGSGKTLAYGVGILDRLEPRGDDEEEGEGEREGPRLLVLAPTPEAARRAALELVPCAHAVEATVSASGGGWGTEPGRATVLAATPAEVLEAVRTSSVKLEGVEAVVVDGASEIEALGGWEALETIFDHLPRDAQRVVVTAAATEGVEDFASRRVKRALRYPAEAAAPDPRAPAPAQVGVVGYVPVSGPERTDVVARLLGGGGPAPVLYTRTAERAAALAETLALRGFLVGEPGDGEADVAVAVEPSGEALPEGTTSISFDVPADEETLRARHPGDGTSFVLVEPREVAHLREIARRAAFAARPASAGEEEAGPGTAELRAFRSELRRALREEDLSAQMLVLEPLFEDFTPAEVAAALSALLRRRPSAPATPVQAASSAAGAAPARERVVRAERPAPSTGAPAAFARLFISLGERDQVRPNDLVGAIAGEADIPGTSIGKIEIRDTFSIVEVPADAADRVIRALNGTTIRNRSVRVDYDRQRTAGARPSRPGGAGRPAGGARPGGPRAGGPRAGGPRPTGPRQGGGSGGGGGARPGGSRPPRGDGPRPTRRPREE